MDLNNAQRRLNELLEDDIDNEDLIELIDEINNAMKKCIDKKEVAAKGNALIGNIYQIMADKFHHLSEKNTDPKRKEVLH